jgi:plasmid stabilization system protein ParE
LPPSTPRDDELVFSPEAEEQLAALYGYTAAAASPDIAARYTEAIVNYCESLCAFPLRGTMRDDVRTGLRITNYKKRAVIAFDVDAEQVSIIGVFYGGQDYETILQDDSEDGQAH